MQRLVGGRSDGSASGLRDSPATHLYPASMSFGSSSRGGAPHVGSSSRGEVPHVGDTTPCFLGISYGGDKRNMRVGEIRLYHTSQCEVACDIIRTVYLSHAARPIIV